MSFATARRDIELRLRDNWATTTIAYDNVAFETPAGDTAWVAVRVFEDTSARITIGNPGVHRQSGLIAIYIYVPQNTGTQVARGYADDIAAIFRDKQFNGITCREASVTNVGDFEQWYQVNVTIPFYWDGTYTT